MNIMGILTSIEDKDIIKSNVGTKCLLLLMRSFSTYIFSCSYVNSLYSKTVTFETPRDIKRLQEALLRNYQQSIV